MTTNELKYLRSLHQKKHRYKEKLFLSEGEHLAEEVLKSELYKPLIRKFFFTGEFKNEELLEKIYQSEIEFEVIQRKSIERIAESKTPQEIITLIGIPDINPSTKITPAIALDNINDPGNLGTIIRTAYWFGVYNIIVSDYSADIFNSKVLRSSQGAIFHVTISESSNLHEDLKTMSENKCEIYVSDVNSNINLDEIEIYPNSVFVFGNESHGVNESIASEKSFTSFRIKPYSDCESLNVASAVAITLNEFRRKWLE